MVEERRPAGRGPAGPDGEAEGPPPVHRRRRVRARGAAEGPPVRARRRCGRGRPRSHTRGVDTV